MSLKPSSLFTSLAVSLALLGGCTSKTEDDKPAVDPQVMQTFQSDLQTALKSTIAATVEQPVVGAIMLQVSYDREGKAVKCATQNNSPKLSGMMPSDVEKTDPAVLAKVVTDACWKTLYPNAPDALYDKEGRVEVRAPLGLRFDADPFARWPVRNAQRSFFEQRLLSHEPVKSVGKAVIRYQADASGHMLGCLVNLGAARMRPADFQLDGALQSRLTSACMKLNLKQMPGFTLNEQQQAIGVVSLEYAPWTTGRQ